MNKNLNNLQKDSYQLIAFVPQKPFITFTHCPSPYFIINCYVCFENILGLQSLTLMAGN